jgi:hypothetical protein
MYGRHYLREACRDQVVHEVTITEHPGVCLELDVPIAETMRHGDNVDKLGIEGRLATCEHKEVGTIGATCAKVPLYL